MNYPKIMTIPVCYEMRRKLHDDMYSCHITRDRCLLEDGKQCKELEKMRELGNGRYLD